MIKPHGGRLINKELPEREKQRILEQNNEFEKIQTDSETWKVIKNIAFGVFSPLEGTTSLKKYKLIQKHGKSLKTSHLVFLAL